MNKKVGARGRIKTLGGRILVRFDTEAEAKIRILAAMWSMTISDVVRILATESLDSRTTTNRNGTTGMSRKIDVTDPENLSDEDRAYLASRGVTPEQEAERQHRVELRAEQIAQQAAHEEQMSPEDIAYQRRIGNIR